MEILGCVRTGPRTREMAQKYRRGRGRVLEGRTQLGFAALIRLLQAHMAGKRLALVPPPCHRSGPLLRGLRGGEK